MPNTRGYRVPGSTGDTPDVALWLDRLASDVATDVAAQESATAGAAADADAATAAASTALAQAVDAKALATTANATAGTASARSITAEAAANRATAAVATLDGENLAAIVAQAQAAAEAAIAPTDLAVTNVLTTPGSQAAVALADATEDALESSPSAVNVALPRLMAAVSSYNDVTGTGIRVYGVGSSVGLGPNGALDAVNANSAYVASRLATVINRLGNLTITHTNASVGGSVVNDFVTQYESAKTANGGKAPHLVTVTAGMNDGAPYHYHNGQTFAYVHPRLTALVAAAQADGADVVFLTTPHFHSVTSPDNAWTTGGNAAIYPAAGDYTPGEGRAAGVVDVVAPNGSTVPASYRHLRVNEVIRRVAVETGSVLLDAERYWFDAVAEHGQDALFDVGQYNHPNLFGFQKSYQRAINAWVGALGRSTVQAAGTPAPTPDVVKRKVNNSTRADTVQAMDAQLSYPAGANTIWEVDLELFFQAPTASDIRVGWSLPAGCTGRWGFLGPSPTATTFQGSELIARSFPIENALPAGGNGSDSWGRAKAIISVGATGGTIGMTYAQDVAGASPVTLYQHSLLRARRIA